MSLPLFCPPFNSWEICHEWPFSVSSNKFEWLFVLPEKSAHLWFVNSRNVLNCLIKCRTKCHQCIMNHVVQAFVTGRTASWWLDGACFASCELEYSGTRVNTIGHAPEETFAHKPNASLLVIVSLFFSSDLVKWLRMINVLERQSGANPRAFHWNRLRCKSVLHLTKSTQSLFPIFFTTNYSNDAENEKLYNLIG